MDCKRVSEVIFLFFDNEMEEDLLSPFRDHVALCGDCARKMDYTRKLLLIVRERCLRWMVWAPFLYLAFLSASFGGVSPTVHRRQELAPGRCQHSQAGRLRYGIILRANNRLVP